MGCILRISHNVHISGERPQCLYAANMLFPGLFRVSYDTRNWMGIISLMNNPDEFETVPTLNRVQLIDDAFSFSQIGELDYGITFQLLKYLKHEKEYVPWMAALGGFGPINSLMKRTPNQGVFQVSRKPYFPSPSPMLSVAFVQIVYIHIIIIVYYRTICNVYWQICTINSET